VSASLRVIGVGTVSTVAGTGLASFVNGIGKTASFNNPEGTVIIIW
jgi:hypothetical protein